MQPLIKLALASALLCLAGCVVIGVNEDEPDQTPPPKKDMIRSAVLKRNQKLAACYDFELRKDRNTPEGKVVMKWDLDESGHSQNIAIDESSTLKIPTLTACLTDEIREMSFPPPEKGKTMNIKFPFVYKHERFP